MGWGAPDWGCSSKLLLLGGEVVLGCLFSVAVKCDGVVDEGVAAEVQVLAGVTQAAGSPEIESVVEVPVDGLGVVAAGVAKLQLTLSAPQSSAVTVNYSVQGVNATYGKKPTGGADFGGKISGTATFKLKSTGQTGVVVSVSIPIYGDLVVEPDELVHVMLTGLSGPAAPATRRTVEEASPPEAAGTQLHAVGGGRRGPSRVEVPVRLLGGRSPRLM